MSITDMPSRNQVLAMLGVGASIFSAVAWLLTWQYFCAIPLLVGLVCLMVGLTRLSPSAKLWSMRIGVVSLLLAFIVAFGLIQYAIRLGYPVKIIVPDNYQGKVWIVVDKVNGQTPKLIDGVWVFDIPPSGSLVINDDAAFTIGHAATYIYANGQPAKVTDEGYGSTKPNEPVGYHWTIVP
ncbi:MAG: hypothetical protein IT324_01630 [Anaerolineae bacterium]|nr:hypothetical protein [Anaerolineae bacterium]